MTKVGISLAEKRLLEHLRLGGRPDDQVGRELIWKFATKMWSEGAVAAALKQHGVTIQEVATMYLAVIDGLMPEPWMNVGGPLLVPTQWFMEPHRLENLLVETTRDARGRSREEWLRLLVEKATDLAHATKAVHDERFGPASVQVVQAGGARSSGGCAALLALGAIATAVLSIVAAQLLA